MRALILGGTAEARQLAGMLVDNHWEVTSSLAGRVSNPRLPVGEVRIGGFGGPEGLSQWLIDHSIDALIDATHPFAEKISASALQAACVSGIPLVALHRRPWEKQEGDQWISVSSMDEAASQAAEFSTVLLTIGRQKLHYFSQLRRTHCVIRCVEPPADPLPPSHEVILSRGPFTVDSELELFDSHHIEALVSKNSGGIAGAKLEAARVRSLPVIMVERPPLRADHVCHTAAEAAELVGQLVN